MMNVSDDVLLASAAQYLIEGQEEDAASVLLSCSLDARKTGNTWWVGSECICQVGVVLSGPRAAHDILIQADNPITQAIHKAIEAVLPMEYYLGDISPRAELHPISPDWRNELLEIARGRGVHNQATDAKASYTWQTLRFRSASEKQIAQALDEAGVFFMPNCRARLGSTDNRLIREPDFLICSDGKWGILEVDGEPFHPPTRTVDDHERDRLFRWHGIRFVEHYDATKCYNEPKKVVHEFLSMLNRQP